MRFWWRRARAKWWVDLDDDEPDEPVEPADDPVTELRRQHFLAHLYRFADTEEDREHARRTFKRIVKRGLI